MIKLEYLGSPAPAPARPPVTRELIAEIARVEPAPVTHPVTQQDVSTALDVTQSIAMPAPSGPPGSSVRSTPEAYRTYYRNLMRKRRHAAKADRVELAIADIAESPT